MEFSISSSLLLSQLQIAKGAISTTSVLPALANFLFDLQGNTLKISSSDLDTFITIEVEAKGIEDGLVSVPSRLLLETLASLPEQDLKFRVDFETHSIEVVAMNGLYKLAGESGEDFPNIPEFGEDDEVIDLKAGILLGVISNTLFAVSADELRPAMTGVLFEANEGGFTFVATDAHKLVRYRRSFDNTISSRTFIVPKKPLGLLKSILASANADDAVKTVCNDTHVHFVYDKVRLVGRLIDGRYPDYAAVIPQNNPNTMTIERAELQNALKRVLLFANKSNYQVLLKITDNRLFLLGEDADFNSHASERLYCEHEGEDIDIAFNALFLSQTLGVLKSEKVKFLLSNGQRAGIVVPTEKEANEDILMLVMPIMVR